MSTPGRDASVVAEYRLLNALIHDKAYRSDSRVYEDIFIHETAKSIYEAILKLDAEDIPITKASLLQAGNEIDYSVNKQIIETVFDIDEGTARLTDILKSLSNERTRITLQEQANTLLKTLQTPGDLNTEELMRNLFDMDLSIKSEGMESSLQDLGEWIDAYIKDLEERAQGKVYPYGDQLLDEEFVKGAYPGAITTIAAATGQGKTSYVINIINSLINMGKPCIYATLELSSIDVYDRMVALRKRIPLQDLYSKDPSVIESIIEIVKQEREELEQNKNFFLVDEPSLSLVKLRSIIKEYKQRTKNEYVVVFVDLATQLKEFTRASNGMSMANNIEVAMNEANSIAKELNVHFVFVAQFGRSADDYKAQTVEELDKLRPTLNDIKNSHALAERSRVVLGLFRKKYYADRLLAHIPDLEELEDILEVQVLKSTNGVAGQILKYFFEGEFFTITPMLEAPDVVIDY